MKLEVCLGHKTVRTVCVFNFRKIPSYMLAACSQAHFAARSTAKMKSHPVLAVCLFNTVHL